MSALAPELEGPKWREISLQSLRDGCARVLKFDPPEERLLKAAYRTVAGRLRESGVELPYTCGRCNSLLSKNHQRCWACGCVIELEPLPRIEEEEVRVRAQKLGISIRGKSEADLRGAIEAAALKKRATPKHADLLRLEYNNVVARLTEQMPDGWYKKEAQMYMAFYDPNGVKRIVVIRRALRLNFAVDDGLLDGMSNVTWLDPLERKRRHLGRENYLYRGDATCEALAAAARVMERYK